RRDDGENVIRALRVLREPYEGFEREPELDRTTRSGFCSSNHRSISNCYSNNCQATYNESWLVGGKEPGDNGLRVGNASTRVNIYILNVLYLMVYIRYIGLDGFQRPKGSASWCFEFVGGPS